MTDHGGSTEAEWRLIVSTARTGDAALFHRSKRRSEPQGRACARLRPASETVSLTCNLLFVAGSRWRGGSPVVGCDRVRSNGWRDRVQAAWMARPGPGPTVGKTGSRPQGSLVAGPSRKRQPCLTGRALYIHTTPCGRSERRSESQGSLVADGRRKEALTDPKPPKP